MESERFVKLPSREDKLILKPKDLLIYITIRRFYNKYTRRAFPSLETTSKLSGISISAIRTGLKRLDNYKYLKIKKCSYKQIYQFDEEDKFEPFSLKFLDRKDLSVELKSYILASQRYMFKEDGYGKISYSNKELGNLINLSEASIYRYNTELISKGLMVKYNLKKTDENWNYKEVKQFDLNKLDQDIVFTLQNHEERLNNIEERLNNIEEGISNIEEHNEATDNKITLLEKQISKRDKTLEEQLKSHKIQIKRLAEALEKYNLKNNEPILMR